MKLTPKIVEFSGESIFVGIDVHKNSWKVSFRYNGNEMNTCSMPPDPHKLIGHLQANYPRGDYHCVYEAGFCGFWIHRELEMLGARCSVIHPSDVPTTHKERKRKSDAVDSRKLARCLENGELTPIHVPDEELEDARQILRRRVQVVKDRTRVKNRIRQLLNLFGIKQEGLDSCWSRKFLTWLRGLEFPGKMARFTLDSHLDQLEQLRLQILVLNRHMRHLSRSPRFAGDYDLLIGIPGIGTITAMTLLTELGDLGRFKSLDELCSYVGLVPDTSSSAETERNLGITKRGNSFIRRVLVECSWMIIRRDPAMAQAYANYCKRMSAKRAVIRIAKKLLSRIRYVLKNKMPYRPGIN